MECGDRCAPAGLKKILNRRKPDLRGRKDANDMIIKNTHKIISEIRSTQIMQDIIFTCQNIIRWSVQDG